MALQHLAGKSGRLYWTWRPRFWLFGYHEWLADETPCNHDILAQAWCFGPVRFQRFVWG